jgi:hypothetical protein
LKNPGGTDVHGFARFQIDPLLHEKRKAPAPFGVSCGGDSFAGGFWGRMRK